MNIYLFLRSKILQKIDSAWTTLLFWKSSPSKLPKAEKKEPLIKEFFHYHGFFSAYHPLWGVVTEEREDVEIIQEFLGKLPQTHLPKEQIPFASYEVLAKALAFRNLKKHDRFTLLGTKGEEIYEIEEILDLYQGIPAFCLAAKRDHPSILLFRGTEIGLYNKRAIFSLLADLDIESPGFTLYTKARGEIQRWLKENRTRAMGFSLGGALTAYTTLLDGNLLDPSLPSLSFNPPGIYKKKKNLHPLSPLRSYTMQGDLVSKVGTVPGEVKEFSLFEKVSPITAHAAPIFL